MDAHLPGQLPLFDEPATPFSPEHQEQVRTLDQLRVENQRVYGQLLAAGAVPDPRMVLSLRLEILIDKLLQGADRVHFDVMFETQMAELLTACQSQLSRAQLLAPTQAGPPGGGLIIPAH